MNPLTASAFDLPEHLRAKAEPTLIAGDEQHFAAVAASLGQSITDLSVRLDAGARMPDHTGAPVVPRSAARATATTVPVAERQSGINYSPSGRVHSHRKRILN